MVFPDWMKSVAGKFPRRQQQALRRARFRRQLRSGAFFLHTEPELAHLGDWIAEGDWAVDGGACVGNYTVRLSELVGESGRVLAFEPVPDTFELLVANLGFVGAHNVSLFNVALSARSDLMSLSIPGSRSGLPNYYLASLTPASQSQNPNVNSNALTLALDTLLIPRRVTLVKLDVEGHDFMALRGMEQLLRRDRPRLIVECSSRDTWSFLGNLGYESLRLPHSPNEVFFMNGRDAPPEKG